MRCWQSGLLCAVFVAQCRAALLRASAEASAAAAEASLVARIEASFRTAYAEAESEAKAFWLGELAATEAELVELQQLVDTVDGNHQAPKNATAAKAKAPVAAAKDAAKLDVGKLVGSLSHGSAGGALAKLQGNTALAPMLAMLKGLYDDTKSRIAQQNAREEKSKKWFAEKEADHKSKLAKIEGKFHNHTLSEAFYKNETRDETRYFTYWQRCRERQHRQFHNNLKIQHGMMKRVKTMIDMYEKALSGKANAAEMKKELKQVSSGLPPEIVLLATSQFCHDALADVRASRSELEGWGSDAPGRKIA